MHAAEYPLTAAMRADGEPLSVSEYVATGGYEGLRKALAAMTPQEVQNVVKDSNLRGRGGAGFPTGQKWGLIPMGSDAPRPKYIISNSDEMEPGTFKDRLLMEGNPHQLIEGLIIAGYAIQADIAIIFLRWAYAKSQKRLSQAITEAYTKGYLGKNILGSGFTMEMDLHVSAGRYICGEETALLNALEGERPIPRSRPPFPQACGAFGLPAIVNNAETLSNIPHIVRNGAEWYRSLSKSDDGGTKIYGVSGRVKNPGVWELPMGTTIRELLEEHARGMQDGYTFRAVIPGGASTDFLVGDHMDVKMDFASLQKAGSRLGTGTMIVLDQRTCPVGMVHNLERFFARESCGWCTPCREGLPWVEKTLASIESGDGRPEDLDILEMHTRLLRPGHTFCVHAPGAMEPIQSALKYFREDFEEHIRQRRCPFE
ncbi:MAG TPA: NADH-quinone oxidoreductase subunit NuoF [Syntrophorhabdaceae bacterium]|nr:NADH-quinone oxidoreductase subunit NuoF [Syntrophorhabdaceae bacterium]